MIIYVIEKIKVGLFYTAVIFFMDLQPFVCNILIDQTSVEMRFVLDEVQLFSLNKRIWNGLHAINWANQYDRRSSANHKSQLPSVICQFVWIVRI